MPVLKKTVVQNPRHTTLSVCPGSTVSGSGVQPAPSTPRPYHALVDRSPTPLTADGSPVASRLAVLCAVRHPLDVLIQNSGVANARHAHNLCVSAPGSTVSGSGAQPAPSTPRPHYALVDHSPTPLAADGSPVLDSLYRAPFATCLTTSLKTAALPMPGMHTISAAAFCRPQKTPPGDIADMSPLPEEAAHTIGSGLECSMNIYSQI
ncbi:hypothetical protein K438DRAFT_1755044 [Mycena galopus ATCC 62051]|nr:hypothetical protein K438DRAFT_1755044 [Mycena galopus ATCC 62051]